jgi:hypothetical protein
MKILATMVTRVGFSIKLWLCLRTVLFLMSKEISGSHRFPVNSEQNLFIPVMSIINRF